MIIEVTLVLAHGKYNKRLIKPRRVFCYWAVRELRKPLYGLALLQQGHGACKKLVFLLRFLCLTYFISILFHNQWVMNGQYNVGFSHDFLDAGLSGP